jgi:hypothetical protein
LVSAISKRYLKHSKENKRAAGICRNSTALRRLFILP